MDQGIINLILIGFVIMAFIVSLVTLVIVAKLYGMHNIKNDDGQYAWMVPNKWCEIQGEISRSQERLVGSIAELSEHNEQVTKLLGSLVDTTLTFHEMIKREKDKRV